MRDLTKAVVVVLEPHTPAPYFIMEQAEACGYLHRMYVTFRGLRKECHFFYNKELLRNPESLDQWLMAPANQMRMTARQALDYFSNEDDDDLLYAEHGMIDCTIPERNET